MTKLVTGAAGFIGSNFVDYLTTKTDEKIIVVDNITYAGDKENIKSLLRLNLFGVIYQI